MELARDVSGGPAIEFALIAPLLLSLVMGGIEFGRLLWTEAALNYSVEAAARCGLVKPDGTCASASAVATYAATVTPQLAFSSSTFTATPAATCGYQVTASYSYSFLVSGFVPLSPTLKAQACFPS